MQGNRRPQQDAGETAGDPCVSQVQRDGRAVGQHADQRRARPAGNPQCDQGNAGHARHDRGDGGQFCAEQQLPDQRRDNQQRCPGRGFSNSSENKHSVHCVDLLSYCVLDMVRNG
jgi:hypothetical protein